MSFNCHSVSDWANELDDNGTPMAPCWGIGAPHMDFDDHALIKEAYQSKSDGELIAPKREWCPKRLRE